MGNLNNLYISQSFQSLAHLGTDTSLVPGQMTVLQDGIGQSLNIFFDGTNISSSGNLYAANITASVINTGSLVTTASFNAYTQSNNQRVSSLEAATSSYITETESGSFLLTASFDNGTRNLTFTKGNNTTFAVNIPDVSGSTINTGSFATTGSNTFVGNQNVNGQLIVDTAGNQLILKSGENGSTIFTQQPNSSLAILQVAGASGIDIFTDLDVYGTFTSSLQEGYILVGNSSGKTTTVATSSLVTNVNTGSLVTTASFNAYTQSNDQKVNSLITATGSYATTGSNTFTAQNTFNSGVTLLGQSLISNGQILDLISLQNISGSLIFNKNASASKVDLQNLSLLVSGTFTSSLQQGYVWVGDATGKTTTVATSSFGGNINTGSLLQTASVNVNVLTFTKADGSTFDLTVAASGSVTPGTISGSAQITALGFVSSSVTASSLITASFDNGTRNLTFTKGDNTTFAVNIPDVSGSSGNFVTTSSFNAYTASNDQKVNSLISTTGSYATTGSNTFNGAQIIRTTTGVPLVIDHLDASPTQNTLLGFLKSGSAVWDIGNSGTNDEFVVYNPDTFQSPLSIRQDNSVQILGALTASLQEGYVWAGGAGNVSTLVATSSFGTTINTGSFITTGSASTGSQTILGDFNFDTTYTGSSPITDQGAGGSNVVEVSYGEFGSDSLMLYWANNNWVGITVNGPGVTNATITSTNFGANYEVTLSSGTVTGGGTYTFTGLALQTISLTGSLEASFEIRAKDISTGQKAVMDVRGFYAQTADNSVQAGASTDGGVYTSLNTDTYNNIRLAVTSSQVKDNNGTPTPFNKPQIAVGQNNLGSVTQISFEGNGDYTNGTITVHQPLFVSSSLNVRNTFTASLQTGYVWVGDSIGKTVTVATSSFGTPIPAGTISSSAQITALGFVSSSVTASSIVTASVNLNTITFTKGDASTFALTVNTGSGGGGGAAFPFTGDAVITGSLLVSGSSIPDVRVIGNIDLTGSMRVQPITLSVASNTASIDMNRSNYFILNLPTSSTTHVAFTNIIPGESINLLVSQSATVATGSIAFAPNIYFPGGNDYVATATGSARDIVSFITFNANEIYATNVKNLK